MVIFITNMDMNLIASILIIINSTNHDKDTQTNSKIIMIIDTPRTIDQKIHIGLTWKRNNMIVDADSVINHNICFLIKEQLSTSNVQQLNITLIHILATTLIILKKVITIRKYLERESHEDTLM